MLQSYRITAEKAFAFSAVLQLAVILILLVVLIILIILVLLILLVLIVLILLVLIVVHDSILQNILTDLPLS